LETAKISWKESLMGFGASRTLQPMVAIDPDH
jgi:hypothetical protein